jgi:P4 family phage/plasmid primase-like protien
MFNNDHLYVAFRPFKFCKGYNEAWIRETNKTQCVYFLVNNGEGTNRKKEDIKSVNALFIDIDGTSEWNGSDGSIVVGRDSTHWHCYWPLVEGEDLGRWEIAQKALIKHFDADAACSDLSRVMRVWGSVNHKPDAKGAVYSVWKRDDKKWTIDEVVGFYGLDMSQVYDHDKMEISMDGVTCPTFVRDELKGVIENKTAPEGMRYATARNWSAQALGAGMEAGEVHNLARTALERWGYDSDHADRQAWNAQSGTVAKLKAGELRLDERLRPDLAFPDEEEVSLTPEAAQAQSEEVGCSSLVEGLKNAPDKFDWLKENIKRVVKLDPLELARLKNSWGVGVRDFNLFVKKNRPVKIVEGAQIFPADDWASVGEAFIPTLDGIVYDKEDWYLWAQTKYEAVSEHEILSKLSAFMRGAMFQAGGDSPPVAIKPNRASLANAAQQVSFFAGAKGHLNGGVPFKNGILFEGDLIPHNPDVFYTYSLSFDYDATATCPTWERCVNEWLDGDVERMELLRQWLYYLISGREDLQKIWVLSGVKRGGKGTILKMINELLGEGNYSAPSFSSFASQFGLQASLDKRAMIIPDAHLPRGDQGTILDRLKSISGHDKISVSRKNKTDIEAARLGVIVIACNELGDIKDESNALIGRYSILNFKRSFEGVEDGQLEHKLRKELSGIFNWVMSCPKFDKFIEGAAGEEVKRELVASSNPVRAWAVDNCTGDEMAFTKTDELFAHFQKWCEDNHSYQSPAKNAFCRSLKQIFPYAKIDRITLDGKREKVYLGIKLEGECEIDGFDDFDDAF